MAETFENDALDGEVVFQTKLDPFIYYRAAGKTFSISNAASSVKDVALFLLYLKHIARRGDLVILEEPEINLHPSSQLLLARLIARLVCAGLHIGGLHAQPILFWETVEPLRVGRHNSE